MTSIEKARINKRYLIELRGGKCHDCDGIFPQYCFHFDHRDVFEKVFNLSDRMHWDFERIREEFEKCDMVCANCHAIRTFTSKDIRKKQGAAQKGRNLSAKAIEERSKRMMGHHVSDETKLKISASRMGQVNTPPGWNHTSETKNKMSKIMLMRLATGIHPRSGAILSQETKNKISESLKERAKQSA
jgi:hypothetical protein